MVVCQIWGDLSSEKSSENYPTEVFCDVCYKDMIQKEEESKESIVLSVGKWDQTWGDSCLECGKTAEEEEEEEEQ